MPSHVLLQSAMPQRCRLITTNWRQRMRAVCHEERRCQSEHHTRLETVMALGVSSKQLLLAPIKTHIWTCFVNDQDMDKRICLPHSCKWSGHRTISQRSQVFRLPWTTDLDNSQPISGDRFDPRTCYSAPKRTVSRVLSLIGSYRLVRMTRSHVQRLVLISTDLWSAVQTATFHAERDKMANGSLGIARSQVMLERQKCEHANF